MNRKIVLATASVLATGSVILATPAAAQEVCEVNGTSTVSGTASAGALACGAGSEAGTNATAIGEDADATANVSIAIGASADATQNGAVAIGFASDADGINSVALGLFATAETDGTIAIGANSNAASSPNVLHNIPVPADGAIASMAIGTAAQSFGFDNTAVGNFSQVGVPGTGDTFIGGTAIGAQSVVSADNGTALGAHTSVTGVNGIAIGHGAQATHSNSVALGAGTTTTASNQVNVGGRTIGGVAAGVLATDAVNVGQLNAAIGGFAVDLTDIENDIGTLFDLRSRDRRDMKQGIASAVAIANAPMPSNPGGISYAVNGATFRGEYAVGGSLSYRLNTESPMALGVGFSYAGNKNNSARVGIAGEF